MPTHECGLDGEPKTTTSSVLDGCPSMWCVSILHAPSYTHSVRRNLCGCSWRGGVSRLLATSTRRASSVVRCGWRGASDVSGVCFVPSYVPACLHESVQFDELVEDIRAEQSPPLQPRVPAYVAAKTKLVALTRLMAGKHDPDLHSRQPPTTPKRDRGDAKAADEAPVTTPAGKVVPAHARMLTGVTVEVDTGEGVRSSVQADHGGTLYRRMLDKSTDTEEDAMQVQLRGDTLVFEARITGRELHDDHVVRKLAGRVHGWVFVPGEFRVVQ